MINKTILITGGCGFIGSHLCKRLIKENNKIICIDNLITGSTNNISELLQDNNNNKNNFIFIQKNVIDKIIIDEKIDEIYHLACIASPDKYKKYSIETLETCFIGTKNMLELAKEKNAKILISSTSEVYGNPLVHPQPEEYYGNVNTIGERSCYDEGKRIAETLMYEYNKKFNVNTKIVRIFNTYGPNMDINDGRVITNFIKQFLENKPFEIYGKGFQTRSFCYIDDMIDGLIRMMNSEEKGPINIGNPYCEFTLIDLVKVFESIVKKPIDIHYLSETENDPQQRKPNIEKAQKLLGFEPKIILEEGLKKTIDYFISNKST